MNRVFSGFVYLHTREATELPNFAELSQSCLFGWLLVNVSGYVNPIALTTADKYFHAILLVAQINIY